MRDLRERLHKTAHVDAARTRAMASLAVCVLAITALLMSLPAFTQSKETFCGEVAHEHSDSCYTYELVCASPEVGDHLHDDSCYEWVLTCDLPEHEHELSCYSDREADVQTEREWMASLPQDVPFVQARAKELLCENDEEAEASTDPSDVVELADSVTAAPIEVEGTPANKDGSGDADTSADSNKTNSSSAKNPRAPADDLVRIARSQLGYAESTRNYEVWDDDSTSGYSVYGDWNGEPYDDWNTAFVSFCMHYAGINGQVLPKRGAPRRWLNALDASEVDARLWIEPLQKVRMFEASEVPTETADPGYLPLAGDLVFFNNEAGECMVGIVCKTLAKRGELRAVVGDYENRVCEVRLSLDDEDLEGYGRLPKSLKRTDAAEQESKLQAAYAKWHGRQADDEEEGLDAKPAEEEPETEAEGAGAKPATEAELALAKETAPDAALESATKPEPEPEDKPEPELDSNPDSDPNPNSEPDAAPKDRDSSSALTVEPEDGSVEHAADEAPKEPAPDTASGQDSAPRPTRLEARSGNVTVNVTTELPENKTHTLKVKPAKSTNKIVEQIEDAQSEILPGGVQKTAHINKDDLLVLDISIVDESGSEVEPASPAKVTVSRSKPDSSASPVAEATGEEVDAPAVIHFAAGGPQPLNATAKSNSLTFTTPSFSVFALAFAVDFRFEGYEYRLPGGESTLLSVLFEALGMPEQTASVAELTFSDPRLVSIKRKDDDWVIRSLAPFTTHETLTARMPNGTEYVIRVEDPKSYEFTFNVSDPAAGWVYARSTLTDSEIHSAVANDGTSQQTVRPRSSVAPTSPSQHATEGYEFVGWRINGYTDFGMGQTTSGTASADLYQIRPKVGVDGVADHAQTFTATFAPIDQHLVLFDNKNIQIVQTGDPSSVTIVPAGPPANPDPSAPGVSGSVTLGSAKSYVYILQDGTSTDEVFFGYTVPSGHAGATYGALAVPDQDSKFVGWYAVDNDNDPSNDPLVCASAQFDPTNLEVAYSLPASSRTVVVQARFAKAELLKVTYDNYYTSGNVHHRINENVLALSTGATPYGAGGAITGPTVDEAVYEQQSPKGATAEVSVTSGGTTYGFVCWRDENDAFVGVERVLRDLDPVARTTTYYAEYLESTKQRLIVTTEVPGSGVVKQSGSDCTGKYIDVTGRIDANQYVKLDNHSLQAVPNEGYEFSHWELEGVRLSEGATLNANSTLSQPIPASALSKPAAVYELAAHFRPICQVTYDLSVIQQVGNNPPDTQEWYSVPWCSKDVSIKDKGVLTDDRLTERLSYQQVITLPDLVPNVPETTDASHPQTIRVSKTKNGYNLLTHTFIGWRVRNVNGKVYKVEEIGGSTTETEITEDGTVLRVGTQLKMEGTCTLEAVWDAYLPGKPGYYGTGDGNLRYNTNTCGFFVRLYDDIFNKGDTGTYTDCLFTSRIFLGGTSDFASKDLTGIRFDFYGDSDSDERAEFDRYDAYLREHANEGIAFTNTHQPIFNDGTAAATARKAKFNGSVITFEQRFPTDEEMFARIRAWNATAEAERKLTINGEVIPQDKITTDYFDLRWYVLKDQHNSWHIDGKLILKHPKLVVKKRFEGDARVIDYVANHKGFYIGVDDTELYMRYYNRDNPNTSDEKQGQKYPMFRLQTATQATPGTEIQAQTVDFYYKNENNEANTTVYVGEKRYYEIGYSSYDAATKEYTWELDTDKYPLVYYEDADDGAGGTVQQKHYTHLKPTFNGVSYYVGDYNYIVKSEDNTHAEFDIGSYTTTKSWKITNPSSTEQAVAGSAYYTEVKQLDTYDSATPLSAMQTVTYTNRYTKPREFVINKLDSVTGGRLAGVVFDFELLDANDATNVLLASTFATDSSGQITIPLEFYERSGEQVALENGTYRFRLTERAFYGYNGLSAPITGTLTLDSTAVHAQLDSANPLASLVETDSKGGKKYANGLNVSNTPKTKQLRVTKTWGTGVPTDDQKPVTMQLLRNGVAVPGKTIQLGGLISNPDAPPSTVAWTHTWTDLPAYVDGTEAVYSVRETWIGVPGAEGSLAHNPTDGGDGFASYTVTQTRRVLAVAEDGLGVGDVDVLVTNYADQNIRFAKVDDSGLPVAGAQFLVERVDKDGQTHSTGPYTSDADGIVTIPRADVNDKFTYEIVEGVVPSGYCRGTRTYKLLKPVSAGASREIGYFEAGEEHDMSKIHKATEIVNPVYTCPVGVKKYRADVPTQVLPGVVFSLHAPLATDATKPDPVPMRGFANLVTDADGEIDLGELKVGTYYLIEEKPVLGYYPLEGPIRITVMQNSVSPVVALKVANGTSTGVTVENNLINVENSTGIELPSTGGTGPQGLYRMGIALLLLCWVQVGWRRCVWHARRGGDGSHV